MDHFDKLKIKTWIRAKSICSQSLKIDDPNKIIFEWHIIICNQFLYILEVRFFTKFVPGANIAKFTCVM
jgi:hypothetical protein